MQPPSRLDVVFLDHHDHRQAETINRVLRASYAVEADLIGVEDFVPLRRTAEDIRSAPSSFHGCVLDGELVAVAEVEESTEATANIASFAVHPTVFRRGIGALLLGHILDKLNGAVITVSTAAVNGPAIALYEKHGFRISKHWATDDGIDMVTLTADRNKGEKI